MSTQSISQLAERCDVTETDYCVDVVVDDASSTTSFDEFYRKAKLSRGQQKIAYLVAPRAADKFLHVSGLEWLYWDGKRFIKDEGEKRITQFIMDCICELTAVADDDKQLKADLTKVQTSSGITGVQKLLSTMPHLTTSTSMLDADPYMLNTANGVLDLRQLREGPWTGLTLHAHHAKYRMTHMTNAAFDLNATSSLWHDFLQTSLPEPSVQQYLQQVCGGFGLIGQQREHMLPILCGLGRNGKGVFYGALLHALGSYGAVASPALFNVDRHATADKPNPAVLDLFGRRLVVLSETAKAVELDAAKIKALTGGDRVKARGVHSKATVEFAPSHQLVLVTNHAPQLPADDPAVWERVREVPWDVVVDEDDRDADLGSKLEDSADAILSWALQGLADYFAHGLTKSVRVTEATQSYKSNQDTVLHFVRDRCEDNVSDEQASGTKELHAEYQRYCRANGVLREHMLSERAFGVRLDDLGFPSKRSNGRRFRAGLRRLPEDDQARRDAQITTIASALQQPSAPAPDLPILRMTNGQLVAELHEPGHAPSMAGITYEDLGTYKAVLHDGTQIDVTGSLSDYTAVVTHVDGQVTRHHSTVIPVVDMRVEPAA